MASITSYGSYIPRFRVEGSEILRVWGRDLNVGVKTKSVPGPDEDTITMATEAARNCLRSIDLDPGRVGALYIGSESHPYAVKPSGTVVAEALGIAPDLYMADLEFACKAGSTAIALCSSQVDSGLVEYGLAIGADRAQSSTVDELEYATGAGAASFLIGKDGVADIEHMESYNSDTPDFWRRDGQEYPSHGGRFTGEPAYFRHVTTCARALMSAMGTEAKDFKYAVFHQPNLKFPTSVGKQLGFRDEQLKPGLLVQEIGNAYAASSLLGLTAVLDISEPGEKILMVSYGSGAGSDAFQLLVKDEITRFRERRRMRNIRDTASFVDEKVILDYSIYAKYSGRYRT
jgi:hydroxymethylglutaryl-CoA synthase